MNLKRRDAIHYGFIFAFLHCDYITTHLLIHVIYLYIFLCFYFIGTGYSHKIPSFQ